MALMGPRVPPTSKKTSFTMPTKCNGDHDFTKYIVEQHHLTLYKRVNSVAAQIDNQPPKTWLMRKQWQDSGGRTAAGDAIWNLDTNYMEKLLAEEDAGEKFGQDSSWMWNVLKELKTAIEHGDVPLVSAIAAFQSSDAAGLSRAEFSSLLAHYKIHVSWKKLGEILNAVSANGLVATFVDMEAAFVQSDLLGRAAPSTAVGGKQMGVLVKMLSERIGRLREVFDMFDPDGSGTITVQEFSQGLKALHMHISPREIDEMMEEFDHDHSGLLEYPEFTEFLLGKKRQRDRARIQALETRLLTFCQEGASCQQRVTPRHWKRLLTDEVQKRLTDNIDLIEATLHEKDPRYSTPDEGYVTPVQLHRALLEKLGLKVSTDHFTHFIQRLPRKTIDGQSFVSYQPFVDYFRGLIRKEKKSRQQTQQVADRRRRKVERNVRKGPPPTRHDAVATAVLEAVKNADWGSRLVSEIRRTKQKSKTYYVEDEAIQKSPADKKPSFDEWLMQGPKKDHRRMMAKQAMQKVELLESQSKETGMNAIMLAFKAADRDREGNLGVSGCLTAEKFKEVIRDVTGTRMQGWNDFEGSHNMSPRQLDYCVDIADKVRARQPIWQWKDNAGVWMDYDADSNQTVSAHKEDDKKSGTLTLKIRGREYKINLDRLEQKHLPVDATTVGRMREIRCAGRPNENAGMVVYKSFVRRLIKAEAKQRYEAFARQGGATRRQSLGELEAETRKLLGGVTYEIQLALHQTLASTDLKELFKKWDKDGDGNIDANELRDGLNSLNISIDGKKITTKQIDNLIEVLDQDDDGQLSYLEFKAQFNKAPKESARQVLSGSLSPKIMEQIRKNKTNLRKIFHAFDADGDGAISAPELRLGMQHLGIQLNAKEIAELIKVMDANGDGSIDWNEFQAVFGDSAEAPKGLSRSYQRVLENRNRIADLHPEIVGMRNKMESKKASNLSGGSQGADAAKHKKLKEKVRKLLRGHRIHLVDAFRVFDTNNSGVLTQQKFEELLKFFDISGNGFPMDDISSLFERLDSLGKGNSLVSLEVAREFFGRDV